MELYILDVTFRPVQLVTEYETLVWTERFAEPGEFELVLPSTADNKSALRIGTYLGNNLTPRVMVIETVSDEFDKDGARILIVKGRSIEAIFSRRVARKHFLMLDNDEVWLFTDKTPTAIMREVFEKICVEGSLSTRDIIPYLTEYGPSDEPFYPQDTMEEPSNQITMEIGLKSVLEAFRQVTDSYPTLGYRLYRNMTDNERLYFDVHTGTDRTLMQSENTPVVFSLPWGTLDSYSDLDSVAEHYNVAYVFGKFGTASVNDDKYDDFERRVLYLSVEGEEVDNMRGQTLTNFLTLKGEEALREARRIALFEGEVPPNSPYMYGRDYFLGDLVDLVGENGVGAKMSVIENIFTIDSDGFRSYPTFQMEEHIDPDTWSGLRGGEVWSTMPGYWSDY